MILLEMLASEIAPWNCSVYDRCRAYGQPSSGAQVSTYSWILIIDNDTEYLNIHRHTDIFRVKNLEVCIEIVYSALNNSKDFSIGFKKQ